VNEGASFIFGAGQKKRLKFVWGSGDGLFQV